MLGCNSTSYNARYMSLIQIIRQPKYSTRLGHWNSYSYMYLMYIDFIHLAIYTYKSALLLTMSNATNNADTSQTYNCAYKILDDSVLVVIGLLQRVLQTLLQRDGEL